VVLFFGVEFHLFKVKTKDKIKLKLKINHFHHAEQSRMLQHTMLSLKLLNLIIMKIESIFTNFNVQFNLLVFWLQEGWLSSNKKEYINHAIITGRSYIVEVNHAVCLDLYTVLSKTSRNNAYLKYSLRCLYLYHDSILATRMTL
jgi:hypothetical protein